MQKTQTMKWLLACLAVALFAIVPASAKANVFTNVGTPSPAPSRTSWRAGSGPGTSAAC